MPEQFVDTSIGPISYDDDPESNRTAIRTAGENHFAVVREIRSGNPGNPDLNDANQPSLQADRITLRIMLDCMIHLEIHGAAETLDQRLRMLHNTFISTGLLSKFRGHSLPQLYKVVGSQGDYGYNIWEAMKFILANFQIYDGAYDGQPLLPVEAGQALLASLPALKEVVLAELGNDAAVKQQVRDRYQRNPHQEFAVLFYYAAIVRDVKVLRRLLGLLDVAVLNALDWGQLPDRVALIGICSQVGEFLQSQHLSQYSRSKFRLQDLQAFQMLRNSIEHIEANTGVFQKIFSDQVADRFTDAQLDALRTALLSLQQRLNVVFQPLSVVPGLVTYELAGLQGFVNTHYVDGVLLPDLYDAILPVGVVVDAGLREAVRDFCQQTFRVQCVESPAQSYTRFRDEIKAALDFNALPGPQKGQLMQAIHRAREALKPEAIDQIAAVRQVRDMLRVDPVMPILPAHIGQLYLALLACLSRLPGYHTHFEPIQQSFPEETPVFGVGQLAQRQASAPLLWQAITMDPVYRGLMQDLRLLRPQLNQIHVVSLPAGVDRPEGLDPLRGTVVEAEMPPGQTLQDWQGALRATYDYLRFQILAEQLRASVVTQRNSQYLLKMLQSLFTRVMPAAIPAGLELEMRAMRNTFAHSNVFVDIKPALNPLYLVRYASMFKCDVVGNAGIAQQLGLAANP